MTVKNIDLFNEYTARIFSRLYEDFPIVSGFDLFAFLNIDRTEHEMCDKPLPREINVLEATFLWLHKAGYIDLDHSMPWNCRASLTAKGLEAMKSIPASLDSSKSIGEELISAVKDGSIETGKSLTSQALTHAFHYLLKYASGA